MGDCDLIWSSGALSIIRERRPFQAEGTARAQAPRGREPPRLGWLEWRSPCGVVDYRPCRTQDKPRSQAAMGHLRMSAGLQQPGLSLEKCPNAAGQRSGQAVQ